MVALGYYRIAIVQVTEREVENMALLSNRNNVAQHLFCDIVYLTFILLSIRRWIRARVWFAWMVRSDLGDHRTCLWC